MSRRIAIVTLYNPNDNSIHNLSLISEQTDLLIVCDNSSSENHEKIKKTVISDRLLYIKNEHNFGLSAAFNIALNLKDICWSDDDFVVFFDQDSKIEKNHIAALVSEYEKLISLGYNVGCLGPAYYDKSEERYCLPRMKRDISDSLMAVSSIMTSSMICRYGDLKKIGFWNEEIFLDMADWDVCWRLQQQAYLCCMTTSVCLVHKLGEGCKKIGPITLKVAKPFREYYQTRDCLKLLHKSYTPLKYKIRFICMITVRPILHILFLDSKKERIKYIFKGFRDYRKGICGELSV